MLEIIIAIEEKMQRQKEELHEKDLEIQRLKDQLEEARKEF